MSRRRVLLVVHTGRAEVRERAGYVAERLIAAGIAVSTVVEPGTSEAVPGVETVAEHAQDADGSELVLSLGGDGTLLRGAELARHAGVPLLGVNLGHVGFLAETEADDLDNTLDRVVRGEYSVEDRLTLDVVVRSRGEVVHRDWALNDAALSKTDAMRMIECVVEVDGRPVSRFGCDGVVCATPTGSTAYAFSGGGPIVWPSVAALLVVPISAHALFARPLVTAPDAAIAIEVLPTPDASGPPARSLLWCDGRRITPIEPGSRIEVRHGSIPVRLAHLHRRPFTDRLVAKFALPVNGWRGASRPVPGSSQT